MTRNRATAKKAGSGTERKVADRIAEVLGDDRIDRAPKRGSKDRGDVGGVRAHGQRVVVECKDLGGRIEAAAFVGEVEVEVLNDGALAGFAVVKRRGTTDPGKYYVLTTLDEQLALMTGSRAHIVHGE